MPRKPLIGIPTHSHTGRDGRLAYRCYATYARAVADAGGAPLLIPIIRQEQQLNAIYEHLRGILFTGGADVDPALYGEPRLSECGEPDADMDWAEMRLARWALEDNLPLLAICRGQQLVNVAAGGTLYQDLPTQYPGALDHAQGFRRAETVHQVNVEPDTRLAGLVGQGPLPANSSHHQAVKEPGRPFVVSARATDGVIEGLEGPQHRFAVAVQWHPEELYQREERHAALFKALVEACQQT